MLADLGSDDTRVVSKAAARIAEEGDAATKRAAGPLLVDAARKVGAKAWRDRYGAKLAEANKQVGMEPTPAQFQRQLDTYAEEEVARLLPPLAAIGGDAAIAFLLEKAEDAKGSREISKAAIAALSSHPPEDKAQLARLEAAKAALAPRED